MSDSTTQRIKYVCEAAVWITFWICAIGGCVQCHKADKAAEAVEKRK